MPFYKPLGRPLLSSARTYFVRTDGSDNNDGLSNDSNGAFLTIQKAVDTVAGIDVGSNDVTISVADGAYNSAVTLKTIVGAGTCKIQGNEGTPSNVTISIDDDVFSGLFIGTYEISGFKISTGTDGRGISASGKSATIQVHDMEFGAINQYAFHANSGSFIEITGPYTISGDQNRHILCNNQGQYRNNASSTVTLSGTPDFSQTFAQGSSLGQIFINSNKVTFSGSATGVRYKALVNGVIDTNGGGATYLPGNTSGTTSEGGIYS